MEAIGIVVLGALAVVAIYWYSRQARKNRHSGNFVDERNDVTQEK